MISIKIVIFERYALGQLISFLLFFTISASKKSQGVSDDERNPARQVKGTISLSTKPLVPEKIAAMIPLSLRHQDLNLKR